MARIERLVHDRVVSAAGPDAGSLIPDFVAGGIVSAFRRWVQDGRHLSASELVQKVSALLGMLGHGTGQSEEPTDIA